MKNIQKHLFKCLSTVSFLVIVLFFIQSCDTTSKEVQNDSSILPDTVSAKMQCFDSVYIDSESELKSSERILASIVFSGTVKEMGINKPGVNILVFDATEKNLAGALPPTEANGQFRFSSTNVVYPVKVIADNGAGYYLEVLTLKAPPAGDTVILFNVKPYEAGVNAKTHNLNVKLKKGLDGNPIYSRKLTFSTDILNNTWFVYTNSKGIGSFEYVDTKANVCSIYTGRNSVPDFNFSMTGISRKANITTEITLPN